MNDSKDRALRIFDSMGARPAPPQADAKADLGPAGLAPEETDALRWRKLMACQRIRIMGTAKEGTPQGHMGLEIWGEYPTEKMAVVDNRSRLTAFVDALATPPQADATAAPSAPPPPHVAEGIDAPQGSHPLYGAGLSSAVPLVEVMADKIVRLRDALTKSHLALSDLGSRIQCTAGGGWQVRHPHSEMPGVIAAVDEAMIRYHAVTRAIDEAGG